MSVILNTRNATFRTALLGLFEDSAPAASKHVSQRARVETPLQLSGYEIPKGTLVFKNHKDELTTHVPRKNGPGLLSVVVSVDDSVIVRDNKRSGH